MNAAFLAADAKESVRRKHILQADKSEYLKLKLSLSDAEIKEWFKVESSYWIAWAKKGNSALTFHRLPS